MLHQRVIFILTVLFVVSTPTASLKLPSGLKACPMTEGKSTCRIRAVEEALRYLSKGHRPLGVPLLEPLLVPSIKIAGNGGQVNLDQEYINLNVSGHTNTFIEVANFNINEKECMLRLDSLTPSMRLEGQYRFRGRIFLLPINGHGPANITLVNLRAKNRLSCRIVGEHIRIKQWRAELRPERVLYDLPNLFDGNEMLSRQILEVIRQNDLEVFESIRADYERTFGELYAVIADQLFSRLKYREVFL